MPFIAAALGPNRSIGIICANKSRLTANLLAKAYPNPTCAMHVEGLQDGPAFRLPILEENGPLDSEAVEAEVAAAARRLLANHPSIGAILLECSNIPPYSCTVQEATGLPVSDFMTMINHLHSACVQRRRYTGRY